jgi:phosphotransferase system HPr (HPr) family protein
MLGIMVQKQVTVQLAQGLHARPATEFVKTASSFPCKVRIEKNGKSVDGKSILGIMSLAVANGQEVVLETDGPQEEEAIEVLARLLTESEV